jgi:hypothetical protein
MEGFDILVVVEEAVCELDEWTKTKDAMPGIIVTKILIEMCKQVCFICYLLNCSWSQEPVKHCNKKFRTVEECSAVHSHLYLMALTLSSWIRIPLKALIFILVFLWCCSVYVEAFAKGWSLFRRSPTKCLNNKIKNPLYVRLQGPFKDWRATEEDKEEEVQRREE